MLSRYQAFLISLSSVLLLVSSRGPAATAQNFSAAVVYPTGLAPQGLVAVDVDRDSLADLLTVNSGSNTVSVLLNQRAAPGTFSQVPLNFPTGGTYPVALSLADVNGDGQPDMVVVNEMSNTVSVLLHSTTKELFSRATAYSSGGVAPRGVAVGDVNKDGLPDIVLTTIGSNRIGILLNSPLTPGKFLPVITFSSGSVKPEKIALADVDGDTHLDMVVINQRNNTCSILLNSAKKPGKFQGRAAYASNGTTPRGMSLGDLNGDGRPDIALTNEGTGSITILLNSAATKGRFTTSATYASGASNPVGIALGDINGDKQPDVIVADYAAKKGTTLCILLNSASTPGTFSTPPVVYDSNGTGPHDVVLQDLNGDGRLDIVTTNLASNTVGVLINTGK
ncbi:VCBS repeat-containing protein (plasmid) [Hymenobacter sp. BRD128]|uniref:FG-GAP repeat domain-containing protein n=1 Tax=Hymenobacter sp. BRD128 TaxID=2675878 RepID=UPI001566E2C4|nr:VCBS repeat-containing protein [Hymenobacter sp. BRD128]QKG59087.1 VCBS repeat-containing protein [Hymenobacter sp. BRD128]